MKRQPTLKDIAAHVGVSVTTVSKALKRHPDVSSWRREEILRVADQLNYLPNSTAQNLRRRATKFVGLILSDTTNPYYSQIVRDTEKAISARGYQTIIFNSNEDVEKEADFARELCAIKVAGAIITPAQSNHRSARLFERFHVPYVLASRYVAPDKNNYVVVDDQQVGYIAADYLLSKRSNKVVFITAPSAITSARDRESGYRKALKEHGIHHIQRTVYRGVIDHIGGYEMAGKVLDEHSPPFSILCYSDYVASGVIRRIHEAGLKVPDDVAVMGIDNIDLFSFFHPSLTTVNIPKGEIGRKSVEMLFDLIEGADLDVPRLVLQPDLVIRESA